MKRRATITATGMHAPETVLSNAYFNDLLGEDVGTWLEENLTIRERRWCKEDESTADLCKAAALKILEKGDISPAQIDLIIVATDTPEYISPSTAAVLQDQIGAVNAGTFDLNTACAGFVTAIDVASKFIIADDKYQHILVIGAYAMSKYLNKKDKKTVTLFADVLSFSWICLQLVLHGGEVLASNYSEIVKRFIPVPLIIFALLLLALATIWRWIKFDIGKLRRHPRSSWWLISVLLLVVLWLGLLAIRQGVDLLQLSFGKDVADGVLLVLGNSGRDLSQLSKLIIDGEWAIRGLGIIALLILPFSSGRKELWPLAGLVIIFIVVMVFASGKIYSRYSLIFEPLQAAAIAAVLAQKFPKVWIHVPAMLVVSALSFGPLKPQSELKLYPSKRAKISKQVFEKIGAEIRDDELMVVCQFNKKNVLIPGAAAYFGSPGRGFIFESSPGRTASAIFESRHRGPLRGVCRKGELARIQKNIIGLEHLGAFAGYIYWRASGWAPD